MRFSEDIDGSLEFSKVLSGCLKVCEVLRSLRFLGFSKARKVLSGSLIFSIARKSSLKFAEIRYVSLGSLRIVKVRQRSPRLDQMRQGSKRRASQFLEDLQASVGPFEVLKGSQKLENALQDSFGFCKLPLGSKRFY